MCTKWRVIVCNTGLGSFEYPWVVGVDYSGEPLNGVARGLLRSGIYEMMYNEKTLTSLDGIL